MMRRQLIVTGVLFLALVFLLPPYASAATHRVPSEYPDIKTALDNSNPYDIVLVEEGVYQGSGNCELNIDSVYLISEMGPMRTYIDFEDRYWGYEFTNGRSWVAGFTFMHTGDEFWCDSGVNDVVVDILDCVFLDCGGYNSSFGVYPQCTATLINCLFIDYKCLAPGYPANAIRCFGGLGGSIGTVKLYFCTFQSDVTPANAFVIGRYGSLRADFSIFSDTCVNNSTGGNATLNYCNAPYVEGNVNVYNSIGVDPDYISGPYGDHYLSQIDAGQSIDSPCVDYGPEEAVEYVYDFYHYPVVISELTTRTDHVPDAGLVDLGFHYPHEIHPTPTPPPTMTPTATGTATCTPTPPTATPTHTPTPREPYEFSFWLNGSEFRSGDAFKLRAGCRAPAGRSIDLYVALQIHENFWFWPDWTESVDFDRMTMEDDRIKYIFILDFIWPEGDFGSAEGLQFWGVMLDPSDNSPLGNLECRRFGYR